MALDAAQVEALQNSGGPTDWSKFDGGLLQRGPGQLAWPGPGDDKLHVRFFMKPRIDPVESEKQQRPVYKDTPYIEMMMPGEKNVIIREPVWDQHLKRFPQHWQQFLAGEAEQVVGTPLKVAPFLTESQVEELAHFKIRTIEQLADLADSAMNFMGAPELKQAARKFIDKTKGNDALLARIEALEAENRKLQAAQALEQAAKVTPTMHLPQGRK
jgi:hypothetical protein